MIDACSIETGGLISIEHALQQIAGTVVPIKTCERVVLKSALGRVLSASVYATINIPPDQNSAMDGYAFSSTDIRPNQPFSLSLAGTSWAGAPYSETLKPGECIRIFTGAVIPEGADSVIMQEHIQADNTLIIFPESTQPHKHIRDIGCDTRKDALLISANKKLTAIDIGLLASAGIYDVQ
ncbi:MAG: molybdopterin molybdenumtransferase MoeA, partial [Methylococcales bacterium]